MSTPREDYPISAEANLFPEASHEEYQDILASIEEIGQQEAIVRKDGQIFDGRTRLRVCDELGVEPRFTELGDDVDPLKYVLAKNLARRHLDASQRAVIAYKLSAWSKPGRRQEKRGLPGRCRPFGNFAGWLFPGAIRQAAERQPAIGQAGGQSNFRRQPCGPGIAPRG